jgi:hypothetical protein
MIEHEMSELEMILEQEQPDEPVLGEIEHPEDARYLINPKLEEAPRAIGGGGRRDGMPLLTEMLEF